MGSGSAAPPREPSPPRTRKSIAPGADRKYSWATQRITELQNELLEAQTKIKVRRRRWTGAPCIRHSQPAPLLAAGAAAQKGRRAAPARLSQELKQVLKARQADAERAEQAEVRLRARLGPQAHGLRSALLLLLCGWAPRWLVVEVGPPTHVPGSLLCMPPHALLQAAAAAAKALASNLGKDLSAAQAQLSQAQAAAAAAETAAAAAEASAATLQGRLDELQAQANAQGDAIAKLAAQLGEREAELESVAAEVGRGGREGLSVSVFMRNTGQQ
jgi:hypothetical protein